MPAASRRPGRAWRCSDAADRARYARVTLDRSVERVFGGKRAGRARRLGPEQRHGRQLLRPADHAQYQRRVTGAVILSAGIAATEGNRQAQHEDSSPTRRHPSLVRPSGRDTAAVPRPRRYHLPADQLTRASAIAASSASVRRRMVSRRGSRLGGTGPRPGGRAKAATRSGRPAASVRSCCSRWASMSSSTEYHRLSSLTAGALPARWPSRGLQIR